MLTGHYKEFKRIASETQKGFWKQQALSKINKQLSCGKMNLLPLKNTIQKFTFGSKWRERNPYKGNLFPSIKIINNKSTKKSNSCDKNNNTQKKVFMTQVDKDGNYQRSNQKKNTHLMRQKLLSIQLQLKEDVEPNQITLIPFIVKNRAERRKERIRLGRVHLTEDNIFKEFISKAFWKKGALTERTYSNNPNNQSDYYTNHSNNTQLLGNMNMNEVINEYKQKCFRGNNCGNSQMHLKRNSNDVYKKKRHVTIFN